MPLALAASDDAWETAQARHDVALAACFEKYDASDASTCIGTVVATCDADHDQPGTTLAIADCHLAEAAGWERLMNAEFDKVLAQAQNGDDYYRQHGENWTGAEAALRAAQDAWDAFRVAQCGYAYAHWGSGSMRVIASAACQRDMFAERAMALSAFAEE